MARIEWLTTAPNPRVRGYGADDGQRGWKLHALEVGNDTLSYNVTLADVRFRRALCGLEAAHGWSIDLFVEDKCAKCVAALQRDVKAVKDVVERRTARLVHPSKLDFTRGGRTE